MRLGPHLATLRRSRRVGAREMARRLGVSRQRVGQLEGELTNHTAAKLAEYLEALGASLLELAIVAEAHVSVCIRDKKRPGSWKGSIRYSEDVELLDENGNSVGRYPSLSSLVAAAYVAGLHVTLNLEEEWKSSTSES